MAFKAILNRTVIALGLFFTMIPVYAAGASYQISVDGLSCPFCAYGIEKELNTVSGVKKVETDIKQGVVIVTMEDGEDLDEATAKQAVSDAGFTLNAFEHLRSDNE